MRIRIRRVEDNLHASMIEYQNGNVAVDTLPPGLRELCLRTLACLPGIKSILIYDHPEHTLLDRAGGHATLAVIADDALRARVLELADLFQWHFSPHWVQESPEEEALICLHCRQSRTHDPRSFCRNRFCDSHAKFQAIIGPKYKPAYHGS